MKKLFVLIMLLQGAPSSEAQDPVDSVKRSPHANADDPSQFLTRMELYNEIQYYDKKDVYLNQTVFRNVIKIGKRFTTRIDIPLVYNSLQTPGKFKQSGLGDISFRLLGYKFFEKSTSAFTASVEISMNTAGSPLLGTGKNIILPVLSYTKILPKKRLLLAGVLQQANSFSGEENRADISFSKLQLIAIKYLSKKHWVVIAPEFFLDYLNDGVSMNLRTRYTHAPSPRLNIWITPSAGIFGDFAGRYQWSADIGGRYFLFR